MSELTPERLVSDAVKQRGQGVIVAGTGAQMVLDLVAEVELLQAQLEDQSDVATKTLDSLWAIVYPDNDPAGWEYPKQVVRHVRLEVERLQADNTKGWVMLAESQRLLREAQAENTRLQAELAEWEAGTAGEIQRERMKLLDSDNKRLQAENADLQKRLRRFTDTALEYSAAMEAENARLRAALQSIVDYGLSVDHSATASTAALMAKSALEAGQ